MGGYRVGVDIGGTFTDIVFLDSAGKPHTRKIPSTSENYALAIIEGIVEVFRETGTGPADVDEIIHGTTVASNTILQLSGARTGLITTKGFRDVLEIRTLRMPRLYDLAWQKPPPLVERYLRLGVDERVDTHGRIQRPLEPAEAERAVKRLLGEGVEAIAVCLLNSFTNPTHELMIKEIIQHLAPELPFSISYEVLPEIKEYERTSTTVMNSYLMPVVTKYLTSLRAELGGIGLTSKLLLMQSNGGLAPYKTAARRPVNIIESGPAAGVIAAQSLAKALGLPNIITFDMGGTTAKASLVENHEVTRALEYQVGGGIIAGSRLLTGAGYVLKVPSIDLAEVGAGGGSLVWIDSGGSLQVGPKSAGALPGPACYDFGGTEPTVTDASLILGYINPVHLLGGALKLNAEKARWVFEEKVAKPLAISVEHSAYGTHQIAASNMIRAIKSVSTERGRDPREYTLLAFGGNGPLFAAAMAEALRMHRVVIPPSPGLFSSFGLLRTNVEYHYSRTFRRLLRNVDLTRLNEAWDRLVLDARDQLSADGFSEARIRIRRTASMHYQGQSFELTTPVPGGTLTEENVAIMEEAFGQEHERTYGHRAGPEEPVEIVNIQVVGEGIPDRPRASEKMEKISPPRAGTGTKTSRRAYFGPNAGWLETSVVERADLTSWREGPCIVEEYDATCLLPPGARATLDEYGNIVMELP